MGQRRGFLGAEQIEEAGYKKHLEDEKKRKTKAVKPKRDFKKDLKVCERNQKHRSFGIHLLKSQNTCVLRYF